MTPQVVHLDAEGISLLIDTGASGLPRVLYWGASLGELSGDGVLDVARALARQTPPATLDSAWETTMSPLEGDGWSGRPGFQARLDNEHLRPRWELMSHRSDDTKFEASARDAASGLIICVSVHVADGGVVWSNASVRHDGVAATSIEVEWLEPTLPVPTSATHLTSLDGRWSREKRPAIGELPPGSTVRQSRRGRPGHDAATIFALSEGPPRWDQGQVWATHAAWSADTSYRVDRLTESLTLLGSGELLRPGEIILRPGDEYRSPAVAFVFSETGLDGIAHRVHTWLRHRPHHPRSPRPFTLNTWEAVYFDHDPRELERLADTAAEVGVERFVLDDGWFAGRRDDTTSLGDWVVDSEVWPDGLRPLADRVHALGMQFGLWFEPEMISLDSDLARDHPDWLLHDPRHLEHDASLSWRSQYVLDLADERAFAHIRDRIDALIDEIGIDYIKWDHNRDLIESVHDGRPGTHAQTDAVYRLIRELKQRHPALEIESCSSGGARTDLGILDVCDRIWASDSNDPVERQDIQRWTGLLVPPELIGAHVGPAESHSSGRVTSLGLRMATSLMGSAGLEWNILACTPDEREAITRFAAVYKELRSLIHSSVVRHPTMRDPAWRVTSFIRPDGEEAVVVVATVSGLQDARAERLRIAGLDARRRFRVSVRTEFGELVAGWNIPSWLNAHAVHLTGRALATAGLQLPVMWPMQAIVLHLTPEE
jgi:alpha-galactosidase